MIRYFAYGSNMGEAVMSEQCPRHHLVGRAVVSDYRLAFTRRSITWGAGAADIVAAEGMKVWGVVYEISDEDLDMLDRKEGYPRAYTRIEVDVTFEDGRRERAMTYVVVDKAESEVEPSSDYLESLVAGAGERALPGNYLRFLETLGAQPPGGFRQSLLVLATREVAQEMRLGPIRWEHGRRLGVLQVSEDVQRSRGLSQLAVVESAGKGCLVRVLQSPDVPEGFCRLDQNVRHALGIRGRENYGWSVEASPCAGALPGFVFVRPRFLVLPLERPARLDSEKNLCILHERNIKLLGLTEGEYVKLRAAIRKDGGGYAYRSLTLRVFSGSEMDRQEVDRSLEYPRVTEIYVDADGRRRLGIAPEARETPVVVSAAIAKLFLSRALYYGVTFLLGLAALTSVVEVVADRADAGLGDLGVYAVSLVCALILTVVLAVLDIRGRVQS